MANLILSPTSSLFTPPEQHRIENFKTQGKMKLAITLPKKRPPQRYDLTPARVKLTNFERIEDSSRHPR